MNNRWIDQYLLRYAVGTIVGAAIVAYLFLRLPETVRTQLPALDTGGTVAVLTAAGLAFCYVASAPLLVFHVSRALFFSIQRERRRLGLILIPTIALLFFGVSILWLGNSATWSFAFAVLAAISSGQILAVCVLRKEREFISAFYRELANARKAEENDIVESYRGIREHGNAYAILLLEVLLGVILIALMDEPATIQSLNSVFPAVLGFIAVWITPASLMLCSAARVEIDFVDSKKSKG